MPFFCDLGIWRERNSYRASCHTTTRNAAPDCGTTNNTRIEPARTVIQTVLLFHRVDCIYRLPQKVCGVTTVRARSNNLCIKFPEQNWLREPEQSRLIVCGNNSICDSNNSKTDSFRKSALKENGESIIPSSTEWWQQYELG